MNPVAIADLIATIIKEFMPVIGQLVQKGLAGQDITHEEVLQALPKKNQAAILDVIKTAARKAKGLPT